MENDRNRELRDKLERFWRRKRQIFLLFIRYLLKTTNSYNSYPTEEKCDFLRKLLVILDCPKYVPFKAEELPVLEPVDFRKNWPNYSACKQFDRMITEFIRNNQGHKNLSGVSLITFLQSIIVAKTFFFDSEVD